MSPQVKSILLISVTGTGVLSNTSTACSDNKYGPLGNLGDDEDNEDKIEDDFGNEGDNTKNFLNESHMSNMTNQSIKSTSIPPNNSKELQLQCKSQKPMDVNVLNQMVNEEVKSSATHIDKDILAKISQRVSKKILTHLRKEFPTSCKKDADAAAAALDLAQQIAEKEKIVSECIEK